MGCSPLPWTSYTAMINVLLMLCLGLAVFIGSQLTVSPESVEDL